MKPCWRKCVRRESAPASAVGRCRCGMSTATSSNPTSPTSRTRAGGVRGRSPAGGSCENSSRAIRGCTWTSRAPRTPTARGRIRPRVRRRSGSGSSPSSFSSARGRDPRPRAVPTRLGQGTTSHVRVGTALASAAALLLVAAGAAAQVDSMARRDTVPRDSTTRRDTTARDTTARDTLPRYLPVFPQTILTGPLPRGTRYTFNADSLVLSNVQTLSDLLAHIPGVYVARGGIYGAGEIVFYGGRGAAGLEIYWDGIPYLPLGRDSVYLDPARISLAPLERIDVIVLPASLRVYLVTLRQRSTETASQPGAPHGGLEPPTARRDVAAVRRRP